MISPHLKRHFPTFNKLTARLPGLAALLLGLALPGQLQAAGPAPVDLRTTANFVILSGAGITTTGGGTINGNIGASPIAGSAIGVTCAQVTGTIYAVDASGPPCALVNASLLTTAKGDLTTAYNDAAGRTTPTAVNLGGPAGIGGLNLAPGLYKFTTTVLITGSDLTLTGGADDVWIFQCAQDLQLTSGIKVVLAGGAQAKNIFWQVGTSAVLGTSSSFKGTILADQSVTMNTSSTLDGRALAFSASVVFNGSGAALPPAPVMGVQQPSGTSLVDGASTRDFGLVPAGGNNSLTFTVTNTGNANLVIQGISIDGVDSGDFSVAAISFAPIIPGGSGTFTIRFAPLSGGPKTAALHVASNDSGKNPFDIAITGSGSAGSVPRITVEQPPGVNLAAGGSQDFGSVTLGGNTNFTFTIRNTGTANLTGLALTIDGTDAALFTVTVNPASPVTPAGSTTFSIRFAPASSGLKTAALHIASNDGTQNPFTFNLTGSGGATPHMVVEQPLGANLASGSTRGFGPVTLGGNASLTFTIRNTGTADLTGLGITISGVDTSQFTVTTTPTAPVAPAGSTTFTVRFVPDSLGAKAVAVQIASNDGSQNPFNFTLTGSGSAAAAPQIVVEQPVGANAASGSSQIFAPAALGGSSSLTFTVKNTGTANLTGLGLTIDGVDASLFTVTTAATAPVTPGGSTTFTVTFAPLSLGVKTAALHLASNDGTQNPYNLTLTGNGGTAPLLVVQQPDTFTLTNGSTRDFGDVMEGTNARMTIVILNHGTADLTTLAVTIDGPDAALFTVTRSPLVPVPPGTSTGIIVQFAPVSLGAKTATLHLVSNDGTQSPFNIIFTGNGSPVSITTLGLGLNAQTGLFEQKVQVFNGSGGTLSGIRLLIQSLPPEVQVYNASGISNSIPYVQHNFPVAPAATVEFLIEYYASGLPATPLVPGATNDLFLQAYLLLRFPFFVPGFKAVEIPPVTASADGPVIAITRDLQMVGGRFLVDFPTLPGRRYSVQYSSDLTNWKTANPVFTAPSDRAQWYDDGPPKTESIPTLGGSRFYRVILLP